ncbi:PREDICTED: LOW QUALITY PROTEIN [Prunus dulcis]|uniref:PREDICTED: LOW QUALITY PROTEIN n=1 Tax=Prunus dulcis TaxID=3755 RepID=A0A5E4F115_PRUDU|nr:PREDICTED: LOW QUALITY PROTEIN [Prunus dulcis]
MVDDMLKEGKLKNSLAVCDVSDSMAGTPMEVSVALGLFVSELTEEPWKGKVITFSGNPWLHLIEGDDLRSKCEFVRRMDWGMNTDFQKVFDLLLQVAVNGNLKPEHMIKRIFVFSDMEFDEASSNMPSTEPGVALLSGFYDDILGWGWGHSPGSYHGSSHLRRKVSEAGCDRFMI